ncbi:ribonuclease H-like domain-containing protein [Pisolithus albus]|nr:ribonuclease H-like domain-containing protein [Pisolithus albus]
MDSELCRVQLEEIIHLKGRKRLTYLIDGWEDRLKRSLYGSIAAEVNQYPVILSLHDMTGHRSSADRLLEVSELALKKMEIEDARNFAFPCFLHGVNTMIGEICSFPWMKWNIAKATKVVTFFNNSHYWGGQLKDQATKDNITRTLKQNCESRWYALILQAISVSEHRQPLTIICVCPDAMKKTNGLSPISSDVIDIVVRDLEFWPAMDQLIKTTKPLVDMIGNCESREASLASCMLELIRCARKMSQLRIDSLDRTEFWMHAKAVFNRRFHAMNTVHHSLTLFLHPLSASGRSFEFMVNTALWPEADAKTLIYNMKEYYKCTGVFAGGQCLPITTAQCPLKAMAIILHSIVPHTADVERYFSGLGGTQSARRCNLTVENFEALSKLHASYAHNLYKMDRAAGKSTHRKHAHMHTQPDKGINSDLAAELARNFTWVPPLAVDAESDESTFGHLSGPESITDEELMEAFDKLDREKAEGVQPGDIELDGNEVLEGQIYDFEELDAIDKGRKPTGFIEDISVIDKAAGADAGAWDVEALLSSEGVSSLL